MRIGHDSPEVAAAHRARQLGGRTAEGPTELLQGNLRLAGYMARCYTLWSSPSTFVGFCPAADDLIVLRKDATNGLRASRIALTTEILDDLKQNLLPLIHKQRDARIVSEIVADGLREDRLFAVAQVVAEGGKASEALLLPNDRSSREEFDRATAAIIDELLALMERYPDADQPQA